MGLRTASDAHSDNDLSLFARMDERKLRHRITGKDIKNTKLEPYQGHVYQESRLQQRAYKMSYNGAAEYIKGTKTIQFLSRMLEQRLRIRREAKRRIPRTMGGEIQRDGASGN